MEKSRDIEEYWSTKAEELGEAIRMKSISHTYYRGIPDTFGILYASDSFLVYEYAKKGRKSLLETIFSRKGGDELTESVRIDRKEIRRCSIVNSTGARAWHRRDLDVKEVLEKLESMRSTPLLNFLAGTMVCVCTDADYILLDTPSNREWFELLSQA
jgi:hypothetical protein